MDVVVGKMTSWIALAQGCAVFFSQWTSGTFISQDTAVSMSQVITVAIKAESEVFDDARDKQFVEEVLWLWKCCSYAHHFDIHTYWYSNLQSQLPAHLLSPNRNKSIINVLINMSAIQKDIREADSGSHRYSGGLSTMFSAVL